MFFRGSVLGPLFFSSFSLVVEIKLIIFVSVYYKLY